MKSYSNVPSEISLTALIGLDLLFEKKNKICSPSLKNYLLASECGDTNITFHFMSPHTSKQSTSSRNICLEFGEGFQRPNTLNHCITTTSCMQQFSNLTSCPCSLIKVAALKSSVLQILQLR
jgi:hypothetical protein